MRATLFFVLKKRILFVIVLVGLLLFLYVILWPKERGVFQHYSIEKRALIDAGHGGRDPGAHFGEILEKDITLAISKELKKELEEKNIRGILTRNDDYHLVDGPLWKDLKARAQIGKEEGVDLLVSIHVNNYVSSDCFGGQVFYHPLDDRSKKLAQAIQEELYTIQIHNTRTIMPGENLYLLNALDVPSVLVEVGFIKNYEDREFMTSYEGQRELARVIGNGIVRYYLEEIEDLSTLDKDVEEAPLALSNQEILLYFLEKERQELFPVRVGLPLKKEIEVEIYAMHLLQLLASGPPKDLGLWSPIEESHVLGVYVEGENLIIDLSQQIKEDFLGGSLMEELIISSLKKTLMGISSINQVLITIEGEKKGTIGGHILLSP